MTSVAIIGAGTAGAATAKFLVDAGYGDITLFEKIRDPQPVGAGFLLQPTGLAVLEQLGMGEDILRYGAKVDSLYGESHKNRPVIDLMYKDANPLYYGLGVHRASLYAILNDAVRSKNEVNVRLGVDITHYEQSPNHVTLHSKEGIEGEFDLVVVANGAKSTLRKQHPYLVYDKQYPWGALWSIVDVSEHNPYPTQLRQKYKTANFMTGLLPTGRTPLATDKELVSFFWSIPVDYYSTWISADKSFDEWKNQVVDLWAETQFVVDQLSSKSDLAFATYNDAVMTQWHDKRVVYIGDAAHCMSPQLGQGANLALIDSYVLSQSLLRNQNIETALAHYTDSRKGNIRFYQNMSRLMTPFYQSDNALYGWLRDVFSWPVTQVPWVKEQMLATLTGEKTGWLSKQPIK